MRKKKKSLIKVGISRLLLFIGAVASYGLALVGIKWIGSLLEINSALLQNLAIITLVVVILGLLYGFNKKTIQRAIRGE